MNRFKRIDTKIQKGYVLIKRSDYPGGCEEWLEAWEDIKELFAEGIAENIFDLNEKYAWTEYINNYAQELEMELHNAGINDQRYHQKRIVYCQELI